MLTVIICQSIALTIFSLNPERDNRRKSLILIGQHAERDDGPEHPNPGHTPAGKDRLVELRQIYNDTLKSGLCMVVSGAGQRMLEYVDGVFKHLNPFITIPHSAIIDPFVGGPTANVEGSKDRILASGTLVQGALYFGITVCQSFNPWMHLLELGDRMGGCEHLLIAAGGEFMHRLNKDLEKSWRCKPEQGHVYEVQLLPRRIIRIS